MMNQDTTVIIIRTGNNIMNGGKWKKTHIMIKVARKNHHIFSHGVGIGVHERFWIHEKRKPKFLRSKIITLKATNLDCGVCEFDFQLYYKLLVMSP
jgi:hypothetical protein